MNTLTRSLMTMGSMLALLTSCATVEPKGSRLNIILSDITGQDGRACVRKTDIRGYAANEDYININGGRNYYVATTLYRCNSLDMASQAAFDSGFPEVCGGGRSAIVTRDGRCPIQSVFEFEDRKAAFAALDLAEEKREALIEEAKKQKAEEKAAKKAEQ